MSFGGGTGGGSVPIVADDPAMAGINMGIDLTKNPMPTGDPAMDAINTGISMQGSNVDLGTGASSPPGSSTWGDVKAALSKLPGALKDAAKDQTKKDADVAQKMQQIQAAASRGGEGSALNALVGLLLQKQNAYFKGSQPGEGQPMPLSRSSGLLGF